MIDDFLKKLGIEQPYVETDDGQYVIDIEDSNEYSKVYSKLDKNQSVLEVEDDSVFDLENNTLEFESEDYYLELNADLDNDVYSLVITEKEQ